MSSRAKTIAAVVLTAAVLGTCAGLLFMQSSAVDLIEHAVGDEQRETPGMQKITAKTPAGEILAQSTMRNPRADQRSWIHAFAKMMLGDPDHTSPEWTSGGVVYQIETWCALNESTQACLQRHNEAVELAMMQFPPDE